MRRIIDYLYRQPRSHVTALGTLCVVFVGLLDHLTGPELFFSVFYFIPIFFVNWFAGKWEGIVMSVASATIWLIADFTSGHTYSHSAIPIWNAGVRLTTFLLVATLLSSLKSGLERERELARKDPLTGVANGRYFSELAEREIRRAQRYHRPFTVVYLDLDNFKKVNDRFGHSTGDTLLLLVADTLQNNVRATDIVARLGGDEFVILLSETGPEQAKTITRKIQKLNLDAFKKNEWPVTFSMGVVTFLEPPPSVDATLKLPDDLMYAVKKSGKNAIRYEVFGKGKEDLN